MTFYRYEYTISGEHIIQAHIHLRKYELLKETPKGYWILPEYIGMSDYMKDRFKKWIPKESKKRYAYPTKDEAFTNLIKRTEFRERILSRQLRACHITLGEIKRYKHKHKL